MAWEFETEPEFQAQLDWMDGFVRNEVEPIDHLITHGYDMADPVRQRLIPPLQQKVRERGLWACHLGPDLGGPGYGQLKLALMNEILGRSHWGPIVFGCHAPDSGNAEILAHYGTPELKRALSRAAAAQRHRVRVLDDRAAGGSDPTSFVTTATPGRRRVGDQRREMVLVARAVRRVPDRAGGHRAGQPAAPPDVDVRGPEQDARRGDHPQRRDVRALG